MCRVLTKEHFIPQKSLYFVDMRKVITSFQMLSATLCFKRVIGPGGRSNPIFSRPGQSQGLLYKHLCNSFINWFGHPLLKALVKISLRRRHALMVGYGAFSRKMDYVFKEILNLALLVQKLRRFCWIGGFCLLVEFHREGSARSLRSKLFFFKDDK